MRPVWYSRISQDFAAPGQYASHADSHGRAGHHTGIDFGSAWPVPIDGKPIRSATPGKVVISAYNETMGHWVGVYYAKDNVTITYWHMSKRSVPIGQTVSKGDILGYVGNSGNSTAPHLHVQVNRNRGFSYHGHIAPGDWVRGTAWWRQFFRKFGRPKP